jgi:hypothetical protein
MSRPEGSGLVVTPWRRLLMTLTSCPGVQLALGKARSAPTAAAANVNSFMWALDRMITGMDFRAAVERIRLAGYV